MIELERIETLTQKLTHAITDVRIRAAKSLLSKLDCELIENDILSLPNCLCTLNEGILACIKELKVEDSQLKNPSTIEILQVLLQIICLIGKRSGNRRSDIFTELLSVLTEFSEQESIAKQQDKLLSDAIVSICAVPTVHNGSLTNSPIGESTTRATKSLVIIPTNISQGKHSGRASII